MNLYRYVENNPVRWVDPFGLTVESNAKFFSDWALGRGPRNRYYGPNYLETQEMAQGAGAEGLRDEFYNNGCNNVDHFNYGTFEAYADTVFLPNTTPFQVGGFGGATAVDNGDGTVTYTINNTAGTYSFFLHLPPNRSSPTGPMSNIYQTFQWTEPIDNSRGCDDCE